MLEQPFVARLRGAKRVLLAGAGGGFDFMSGLPLAFALEAQGCEVTLANLSFSNLDASDAPEVADNLFEVRQDAGGSTVYFPERELARWSAEAGHERPVYCFRRVGPKPLERAYRELVARCEPEVLIVVDGGTDSLMRGDEAGLGTPVEDVSTMLAVDALDDLGLDRLLVCLGFGVDTYHGVCHAQVLRNIAALSRQGAYLGALALLPGQPEVDRFLEAVEAVQARHERKSIVCASVSSAIEGDFGDVHRVERTQGSELFINPLMSIYWGFDLGAVVDRLQYAELVRDCTELGHMGRIIRGWRKDQRILDWREIPL